MASLHTALPRPERQRGCAPRCWGPLSCFGTHKGGKRIVPASRTPEGNASAAPPNGTYDVAVTRQATTLVPALLAPPSSPASFTHSTLNSTIQSPSCFTSVVNSPGGPSTMFATGPYAHETQLVSPPVFSTFTTEPSTAPLTPPPEMAHLTTPSSPDVPFAQFFSSSAGFKTNERNNSLAAANDLHASYSYRAESPAVSKFPGNYLASYPEQQLRTPHRDHAPSPQSGRLSRPNGVSMRSQDSNFFCPVTFARFYLDYNSSFPYAGGRLSISKDSDVFPPGGNACPPSRPNRSPRHDAEEMEAYRASFGFSADEIVVNQKYMENFSATDDSFTMAPFASSEASAGEILNVVSAGMEISAPKAQLKMLGRDSPSSNSDPLEDSASSDTASVSGDMHEESKLKREFGTAEEGHCLTEEETEGLCVEARTTATPSKIGAGRKYRFGLSSSDAEIDYRGGGRASSGAEGRGDFF